MGDAEQPDDEGQSVKVARPRGPTYWGKPWRVCVCACLTRFCLPPQQEAAALSLSRSTGNDDPTASSPRGPPTSDFVIALEFIVQLARYDSFGIW